MIAPLAGLRAFAAIWVVCHHLRPAPAGVSQLFDLGYLGVDLFGFLSGFVMTYHYAEPLAARRTADRLHFLWLRAVRIFPLHWFALALLVAARLALPGFGMRPADASRYGAGDLAQQILMVHGWGIADRLAWNVPSWTVSSEWLCYLAFPFAAPAIARLRSAAGCAALAAAAIVATAVALAAAGHRDFNAAIDWGWLRIGGEFLAGCFLERAWALGFARGTRWDAIAIAALGAAAAFVVFDRPVAVVGSFAVLVLALAHQSGPLARALAWRPIVFLGDASYAVYLMHWVVLRVLLYTRLAPIPLTNRETGWGTIAVDFVWVAAAAIAAHLAFDVPIRRRLRGLVARPAPPAPAPRATTSTAAPAE